MLIFNSREKDRNYHRSKNKLFNHENIRSSKERLPLADQGNNVTINLHMRAKSPSKQQRGGRSPSKGSRKSKNSVFSDQDKLMTRQVGLNVIEYNYNGGGNEKRRQFISPQQGIKSNIRKQRLSQETKRMQLVRSKQLQKEEHTRRKQRFPKLFEGSVQTPKRTPPRSPRNQFMQQQGQINQLSNKQAQELDQLREQNQFYKIIYKASLQKMKRLQNSIEKEKEEYIRTKEKFNKELKNLKYKINRADKKVSIGHIYSYDQKDTLNIKPQNIIPETDNEASQISKNNQINETQRKRTKDQLPSRLSIDST